MIDDGHRIATARCHTPSHESRPRLGDGGVDRTEIDPATEQRLRSLGYLE
jgi:hypothetical protein